MNLDMPNVFTEAICSELITRIETLTPDSKPLWGRMNVGQMFAHCSVPYEMIYEDKHEPIPKMIRVILRMFARETVVGTKPYKKNAPTGKGFLVSSKQDFEQEKKRLVEFIRQTKELGIEHFEGKEQMNFGILTSNQWNNMFYKHLDHHLKQFGA